MRSGLRSPRRCRSKLQVLHLGVLSVKAVDPIEGSDALLQLAEVVQAGLQSQLLRTEGIVEDGSRVGCRKCFLRVVDHLLWLPDKGVVLVLDWFKEMFCGFLFA